MLPVREPVARISTFSRAVTWPDDRTQDHHGLGGDFRLDVGVGADGERVIRQADAAVHLTREGEVLGSTQLAPND